MNVTVSEDEDTFCNECYVNQFYSGDTMYRIDISVRAVILCEKCVAELRDQLENIP